MHIQKVVRFISRATAAQNRLAGILVLSVCLRFFLTAYGAGNTEKTKWPSWSIAKSVTSTLVGAALKDGYIQRIDDPVTKYLPELKGSGYEGATIKDLLQMSSGIRFNEDYADRDSDFGRLMSCYYDRRGASCVLNLAKAVSRREPAGRKFRYATLDTTVVGLVVMAASHKTLADYLSKKIWSPFGMEEDALWVLDSNGGQEFGGALIGATLRDYGRFGELMLTGGKAGGKQVVPETWVDEATHPRPDTPQVNYGKLAPSGEPIGYGYSWWFILPTHHLLMEKRLLRPQGFSANVSSSIVRKNSLECSGASGQSPGTMTRHWKLNTFSTQRSGPRDNRIRTIS